MRLIFNISQHRLAAFATKILGLILVLNLIILPILWALQLQQLFTIILIYEALFILFLGVLQILSSYIYRADSIHSRWGGARTGWFDFKKFAKLEPEKRKKYRQEGEIMVIIGLIFLVGIIVAHVYLTSS